MPDSNIFYFFEIVAVCIEAYTVYCLQKRWFQARYRKVWPSVLAYLAFGALTGFFSIYHPSMGLLPVIAFAGTVCVSVVLYQVYFAYHFFAAFLMISVGVGCETVVSFLHSKIFSIDLEQLHMQGFDRIWGLIMSKLLCLAIIKVIAGFISRHRASAALRTWKTIPVIVCQLILIIYMTSIFISAYRNFGVIGTRDIVGIVVSLFVSFFIFIFHDMMTFAYEQKYENQIAKIQLDSRISSDADKEEQYEDALSIQHDWRMFLNVVRNLKSSGYDEEARKYQDSIEKTIDKMTRLVSSPNKVVNAIMNDHLRKAEDLGVSAKFNVSIPETLGIDDVDLTIIIGNVLKNALEALEAVDEGAGRELSITLRQKDEFLVFEVVNTFNPDAVKKRTASRGRGLNNIRKSIKKYGGTFSATPNGTSFTSSAILNSYVRQR